MTEQNKQSDTPAPAQHVDVTDARVEAGAKAYFRWFSSEGTSEAQRDIARDQVRLILNAALAAPLTNNPVRVITDDHIDAFKLAFHGSYDGGRGENDYNKNIRLGLEASVALIPSRETNMDARIAELEAELADARLEIEGILARRKTVGAPSRAGCEEAAAKVASFDGHAAELINLLPYYIDNASTWRGIAAAMGYEPLAHQDVRPVGQWLKDRVAMFRAKVVADASPAPETRALGPNTERVER